MRLAKPVTPKVRESLVGFLMRAAEQNHLRSVGVLRLLLGRTTRPPGPPEAERLAAFCRCSVAEVSQLFGFQIRRADGRRAWRLGDEWVTQPHFISARSMAVCVHCLREDPYVPGTWELTLYRCCAFHRTRLLTICPGCGKALRWTRPRPWQCGCGFDLRLADTEAGGAGTWVTAQLIEHRLDPSVLLRPPAAIPDHLIQRLDGLSLDGLCKTLWFLGHFVAGVETRTLRPSGAQRRPRYADAIIEEAFALLASWPDSLRQHVATRAGGARGPGRGSLYERLFRPLVSYLEQELAEEELAFLRRAYEQQIRALWRSLGRQAPRALGTQLELDLDDC